MTKVGLGSQNPQPLETRPSLIPWPGNSLGWWRACTCAQLCPILGNPKDCSPPGSSAHGIVQARILEWAAWRILEWLLQWCCEPYEVYTWPKNWRENKEGICKGEERMRGSNSNFFFSILAVIETENIGKIITYLPKSKIAKTSWKLKKLKNTASHSVPGHRKPIAYYVRTQTSSK